jgi:Gpi18-like mannosyltransferase
MSYLRKHPLLTLFILGILIRVALLFLDFSFDVHNHISWAQDLWKVGFSNFYFTPSVEVYASLYPNYPPLAMYIFYFLYPIHKFVYSIFWWLNVQFPIFPSKLVFIVQERYFVAATMKIPSVLADMGIAWMTYAYAKQLLPKVSKEKLLLFPALILLNPAFFYNSAFWGQIDAIPIFFVLAATYFLLYSQRYLLSGLFFTAALLIKPTPIVFLPIFTLVFMKKFGVVNSSKAFILSNIFFIVSFVPLLSNPFDFVMPYKIYLHNIIQAQSLAFVTNGAYNLWAFTLFNSISDSSIFLFNMTYRSWSYIILCIALLIIIKLYLEKHDLFYTAFLSAFAFFLFATKMHERYTLLILPFLLLAGITNRNLLKWFYILSFLSFINLYRSWPVPRVDVLFEVLKHPVVYLGLTIVNFLIFFYLLTQYSSSRTLKAT